MSRKIAIRNPRGLANPTLMLVGIALLGLLVYLLLKNRQPALGFRNAATWDIKLNDDGIPIKVTVTRDVKPQ